MVANPHIHLSRRERQIMNIIYELGQASVADVMDNLPNPPKYSSVRALLNILEKKGYLKHKADGPRYLYIPTRSRTKAANSAIRSLVRTFFDNSTEKTVAALLKANNANISDEELDRLAELIEQSKKNGQ